MSIDMKHQFSLCDELLGAIRASGLTTWKFAEEHGVRKSMIGAVCYEKKRSADSLRIGTLEKLLRACGRTLDEYEPRLKLYPAAAQVAANAMQHGMGAKELADWLGFSTSVSFTRSVNAAMRGWPEESGIRGALLMLGTLDASFTDWVEQYLMVEPEPEPEPEPVPEPEVPRIDLSMAFTDEESVLLDKLVRIGKGYGFSDSELRDGFIPKEKKLVWYSHRLYRFELDEQGFTAYWRKTNDVSVRRNFA